MLEDFPQAPEPAPAPPSVSAASPVAPDVLAGRLRVVWFLVPGFLLGYDLLLGVWNLALRSLAGGGLGMAFAWLPWLLHTGLVLGLVGWVWSRRAWPPSVQAALLAAAALPLLRFGVGQVLAFTGAYRMGSPGFLLMLLLGPLLGLALAAFLAALDLGGDAGAEPGPSLGALAVAGVGALSGGWFTWALLPLLASMMGSRLPRRLAEPGEPEGEASPAALRATGGLALASALAAALVPLVGLMKFRGASGTLLGSEGLALVAAAVTWNILGMRWARGRADGRLLRLAAWLVLALPVLLVALLVALLLVFKPRLF